VSDYEAAYEDLFVRNLRRYASIGKADENDKFNAQADLQ
jgi:hypothetical protein